jgi:hypothetical protein
VPVDVWGTSVPEVCDVPDVVDVLDALPALELEVVEAGVVDVVDELEVDGLLEQAASASAHAETIERLIDHARNVPGIRRVYGGEESKWAFPGFIVRRKCIRTQAETR